MPRKPDRVRTAVWLALGLASVFTIQAMASTRPGITWDEPAYVASGYSYCLWVGGSGPGKFSKEKMDSSWGQNAEHPPAAKMLYGLAGVIERGADIPSLYTARLFAAAMFTLLVGLVYAFTARVFGRAAGVTAALALVLMPQVFGHGRLAALDVPAALTCFAAAWAFVRARGRIGWMLAAGALWGVALLTKANAVLVPAVLIPWAAWRWRKAALAPSAALLVLGAAVFLAGWPWLWHDTRQRLETYILNKTERLGDAGRPTGTTNVPVYYMGKAYRDERAPWHYPFVLTLATTPAGLLVLAGLGARKALARERKGEPAEPRAVGVLMLASALAPLAVIALPMVPKYDGVRLFMPAFPFVACLAGVGAAAVWRWHGRAGRVVVAAVLTLSALVLWHAHPYELSYYNALVGGAFGANRLGFETTYWGDTVNRDVLDYVNANWKDGSTVTVLPPYQAFTPTLPGLKDGLHFVKKFDPNKPPDCLIVFPRQGYWDDWTRNLVQVSTPAREWAYLGVPQCMVYAMR